MKNREGGNILVIILGIIFILFLIGFFRSSRSVWSPVTYKNVLQLPCGLTVEHPSFAKGEKVVFPLEIDGYVNGCGWDIASGAAGTAQIFDGHGLPVSSPILLAVSSDQDSEPYYFSANLTISAPPGTDTGTIILRSTSGLVYPISLTF